MNWDQQIQGEEETDIETFETERSLEGLTEELPKRRSSRGRGVSMAKRQPTRSAFRKIPARIRFPYSPWPGVTVIRDRYGNEPPTKTEKPSQEPGSSSSSPSSGGASPNPDAAISEGSEYIRWVQNILNNVLGLRLPLDGVIGPDTRSALRSFQQQQGLPVDGLVGPNTERALIAASGSQPSGASAEFETFDTELADQEQEAEVNRKSSDYIKWVQRSLNQIMELRLAVDGICGPQTHNAIRGFQQQKGLQADGIVGPLTERALIDLGAVKPPESTSAPSYLSRYVTPNLFSTSNFIIGGIPISPPSGVTVTNFLDPNIPRFRGRNRRGSKVNEFIIHETVTQSVADTIQVLQHRGLGVHLIMGPKGEITQHGDLADDTQWHAGQHNSVSVGIEVVNPYYPKYLRPGLPWANVINAGWAHKGHYIVPTPQQTEAVAQLIGWITSPAAIGLAIPRNWIGRSNSTMAMGRVAGAEKLKPGIYAHTYFAHADGSWLALYAFLRIERGRTPTQAYAEAMQLASTSNRFVMVP